MVVRRETPNSHDQYLSARQTDKATVQLAANASDPAIRELLIDLLNGLQPEVDACYDSDEGQELQRKMSLHKKERDQALGKHVSSSEKDRQGKPEKPNTDIVLPLETRRSVRKPDRYDPSAYNKKSQHLVAHEDSDVEAEEEITCGFCHSTLDETEELNQCFTCGMQGHAECLGMSDGDDECDGCYNPDSESTSQEAKGVSVSIGEEDEDDEDDEGVENTIDEEPSGADGVMVGDEDDDESEEGDEDDEEGHFHGVNFALKQAREDLIDAQEEEICAKTSSLEDFVSQTQPDDETRHKIALLSFPYGKEWTLSDLDVEINLRRALHLLYNRIQGKTTLHFGKSIHIKYTTFPKKFQRVKVVKKRAKLALAAAKGMGP